MGSTSGEKKKKKKALGFCPKEDCISGNVHTKLHRKTHASAQIHAL